jgi:hypothetical protein
MDNFIVSLTIGEKPLEGLLVNCVTCKQSLGLHSHKDLRCPTSVKGVFSRDQAFMAAKPRK